jgi:small subunit ribosomal protein S1
MEDTSERTLPEVPPVSPVPATPDLIHSAQPEEAERPAATAASGESAGSHADAGPQATPAAADATAAPAVADAAATPPLATDGAPDREPDHDAGDDAESDAEGEHDADGEAAASGAEGDAAAGKAPGKRKRRRRRKRKDGTSAGEISAAEPGDGSRVEAVARKKETHAPFAHRFGGAAGSKRHAFAVNEVVAGRVQRVEYGVIVIDLFGKATAIADEYEPREIPPLPEPVIVPEAPDASAVAASSEPGTLEASGSSAVVPEAELDPSQSDVSAAVAAAQQEFSAPHELAASSQLAVSADVEAPAHHEALASEAVPSQAVPGEATAQAVEEAAPSDSHITSAGDIEAGAAGDDDDDDDHEPAASIEPPRERPEPPAIGQVFKGRVGAVAESGHIAILNRIIDTKAVREQLSQFREQHKRVHGVVFGFNRGGFDVLVEGLRAFCPASAMSLDDISDPMEFVGHKLEFLLPTSKAGSKDIIVSRRSILERLQRRKTKDFLRSLTPGQRFKGKVTAVRDFGLFVDIGGVEGLVHQSELSYAFGVKPHNVSKVGDEVDVQVLRVGGEPRGEPRGDQRAEPRRENSSSKRDRLTRVSLSIKALLPDPWDSHADALNEGAIHKGKVVRATDFGAFIEIVPEIEGLLHITELGRDLKHANLAVKEGEEIYVAVERVDRRARRISLSKLSAAEVQEFEAGGLTRDESSTRNLRQGNNVKLKVERIEPRCVFARVAGTIGKRGRAFIPSSETGTERGSDLRKRFPIGSELEAKIIGIDRDGSLKCSVKAMEVDEERKAVKDYRREAAKQGFGTFGDLLRAKLGEAQTK